MRKLPLSTNSGLAKPCAQMSGCWSPVNRIAAPTCSSVLDKPDAARLGVTPETPGVVAVGTSIGLGRNSVQVRVGPLQSFTIGNETIRDTEIRFAHVFKDASYKQTGSNVPVKVDGLPSMLLGVDFLRSHRVLVAHSQRRIYFTHNGGPVFQLSRPTAIQNDLRPADNTKPGPKAN